MIGTQDQHQYRIKGMLLEIFCQPILLGRAFQLTGDCPGLLQETHNIFLVVVTIVVLVVIVITTVVLPPPVNGRESPLKKALS